jgi:RNA polymerase sigma factor (sigma-70 family)
MAARLDPVASGRGLLATDDWFEEFYQRQWWPMLRVALGLVDDRAAAEDVVQDAFAGLYSRRANLHAPEKAAAYLRASVVNAARSTLRRRGTARTHLRLAREEFEPAADHQALLSDAHRGVRAALAALPDRQREVLTLRLLAGLSDAEIVDATGLTAGNVRSAVSRGLAALRNSMEAHL